MVLMTLGEQSGDQIIHQSGRAQVAVPIQTVDVPHALMLGDGGAMVIECWAQRS